MPLGNDDPWQIHRSCRVVNSCDDLLLAIQRFTEGFEKQTHKKGVLEDLGPEEPPETANCLVPGHCFKGRGNDVC